MSDINIKKFSAVDYDAEKYVKELSQRCVGGLELTHQRQKILNHAEETNNQLKRNVYLNYTQFIETAKEISHLESEMYQLSHLLSEQRALLSETGNNVSVNRPQEDEKRIALTEVLENIEGCENILQVPTRVLQHHGVLVELDTTDYTAIQRIQFVLMNDGLIISTFVPNRRGLNYKFQVFHSLDSLAVVNVRDFTVKDAFKILVNPDTRLFQCNNMQSKTAWLEAFDITKKSQKVQNQEKAVGSDASANDSDSHILFEEKESESPETQIPEWVSEAPDDMDVFIAQRHFEDAYSLIVKYQKILPQLPHCQKLNEIQKNMDSKIKNLTNDMMNELKLSPDSSMQGGLRAARRIIRLLNLLGCSNQACELFLQLSSSLIKSQLKRTKREGVTFINQLGKTFFNNLMEISREFLKCFPNAPSCTSSLILWIGMELQTFVNHLNKHLFIPQSSLSSVATCVVALRKQSEQLCEIGLDIRFELDGLLNAPLLRALQDTREKLIDAVKIRCQDDAWRQTNLQNRHAQQKFIQEMNDMGFKNIESYAFGENWVYLTANTIAFTKLYLNLLENCMNLVVTELEHTVGEILGDVLCHQMRYIETCLTRADIEPLCLEKNYTFLYSELLPLAEKTFQEKVGHTSPHLQKLFKDFNKFASASKPITKYSTMGYI